MIVLGIACPFWHDPSAAILVDGETVAAVEQERFSRVKHAPRELPLHAVRYCLEAAGVTLDQVDVVAFPWSLENITRNRWAYARRAFGRQPKKAFRALYRGRRKKRYRVGKLERTLDALGADRSKFEIDLVEHHLAHVASASHFSGMDECAVATIDGVGEVTTCLFGEVKDQRFTRRFEVQRPDSLGLFYASITEYLGFDINDGEFKVMGMSCYGDPSKADLSDIVKVVDGDLWMDLDYVWAPREKRWKGASFGTKFVERFGPPRVGDEIDEPYVHIAAAAQKVLEDCSIRLIEHHLGDALKRHGNLALAGGCALNVAMNRKLMEHPLVRRLYVPPSPGDAGTAIGAAAYAAAKRGDRVKPLPHAYWGPSFTTKEVCEELDGLRIPYTLVPDAPAAAAELLARGEVVAWFQGRMEWGPRALGNRSILGNPGHRGTADDINARIKYRERWRPFCPSVLAERAEEFLGSAHPAEFMTLSFRVPEKWSAETPEVVHVDGTVRPQAVSAEANPRYHRLLREFEKRTGLPCVINTSLNRRGEPMICAPKDALAMFYGSGLEHLFLEDVYVTKGWKER